MKPLNPKGDKNSNTFFAAKTAVLVIQPLPTTRLFGCVNKYRTYSVQAITVSGGAGTVINNGKIYLDGTGSSIE